VIQILVSHSQKKKEKIRPEFDGAGIWRTQNLPGRMEICVDEVSQHLLAAKTRQRPATRKWNWECWQAVSPTSVPGLVLELEHLKTRSAVGESFFFLGEGVSGGFNDSVVLLIWRGFNLQE
jgi:hypothetical protein